MEEDNKGEYTRNREAARYLIILLRAPYGWESMARWCSRRRQQHSEKKAIEPIACQAVIRESAAIANRHNDPSQITAVPCCSRYITFSLLR